MGVSRGWGPVVVAVVLAAGAAVVDVGGAGAGEADVPRLNGEDGTLTFSGEVTGDRGLEDDFSLEDSYETPGTCAQVGCVEWSFEVALPDGIWAAPGDGVQISTDWYDPDVNGDLNLSVYGPDGETLALSDDASWSDAVRLERPANGVYRVVVAGTEVGEPVAFRGFVEVEHAAATEPRRSLLPNLMVLPAVDFGFVPDPPDTFVAGDAPAKAPGTCYPEDTAQGAQRCLIFDVFVGNTGDGSFELHPQPGGRTSQRVYDSDGTFSDKPAGPWEPAGDTLGEPIHYPLLEAVLLAVDDSGKAKVVRSRRMPGHCPFDIRNVRFGTGPDGAAWKGESARTYGPCELGIDTDHPGIDVGGATHVDGLSPGWADQYEKYIELSGVPDGVYVLEVFVDPDGVYTESDRTDNRSQVTIRLAGDSVEVVPSL